MNRDASGPAGCDDGEPLDDARLDELARRHVPALEAFVRVRMGAILAAREASVDIVQSVFRELVQDRDRVRYRGDEAFRGWLFTAALRKILERARYHGAALRNPGLEQAGGSLDELFGAGITPSRDAAAREEVARLEVAFGRLDDADREIVTLAKIVGMDHASIAARLGIRVDSSRSRLRRALIRLSRELHMPLRESESPPNAGPDPAP